MNIKLLRMQSGEEVVAELVGESETTYDISNPLVMIPGRDGTVGFAPWAPLLAEEVKQLTIRASFVVYVSEPNSDIVENYKNIFSPIITPQNAGKIIT